MSWLKKFSRLGLFNSGAQGPDRHVKMGELSDQDRAWLAWFRTLPEEKKLTVEAWARKGIKVTPDILEDIMAIDAAKTRLVSEWRTQPGRYRRSKG